MCKECKKQWHLFCLSPPPADKPDSSWLCGPCRNDLYVVVCLSCCVACSSSGGVVLVRGGSDEDFGFDDGEEYTIMEYKDMADKWKRDWFRKIRKGTTRAVLGCANLPTPILTGFVPCPCAQGDELVTRQDMQNEYWRIVETGNGGKPVEVEYGSDLDVSTIGTGGSAFTPCLLLRFQPPVLLLLLLGQVSLARASTLAAGGT